MTTQVIITLSVEVSGDDYSTGEPNVQRVELDSSPAQVWQYELQAADNYLLISDQIPPTYLWLDPLSSSGSTWSLKGASTDIGIPLNSGLPSLIPTSLLTPFPLGGGFTVPAGYSGGITAYQQYQVLLTASQQMQTKIGWF